MPLSGAECMAEFASTLYAAYAAYSYADIFITYYFERHTMMGVIGARRDSSARFRRYGRRRQLKNGSSV